MPICLHRWEVINPFELVRKYECFGCSGVAMCSCDERLGRRVLPHQLGYGTRYRSAEHVPVTLGFVDRVCCTCRSQPEPPHPKAEGTNVKRYYWREIHHRELLRFADWCDANSIDDVLAAIGPNQAVYNQVRRDVLAEIKTIHAMTPVYTYEDPSDGDVLEAAGVTIDALDGTYVAGAGKDRPLVCNGTRMGPEDFARAHYAQHAWDSMLLESRPLHALFGVLMWMWVQDPADQHCRPVGIRRESLPNDFHGMTMMMLPDDFGRPEHAHRRADALEAHLTWIGDGGMPVGAMFDYWVPHSQELTAYLWADAPDVIERARRVIEVVGDCAVITILRFLVEDYWGRYLGWPDLLLWNDTDWKLVEVKSSGDSLSGAQRDWITANAAGPRLPFHLAKIHRRLTVPPAVAPTEGS